VSGYGPGAGPALEAAITIFETFGAKIVLLTETVPPIDRIGMEDDTAATARL
jgi:hypothetical protein